MIRVTQGHEKSIALEVFIKSYLSLSKKKRKNIVLYCYESSLKETLIFLKIPLTKSKTHFLGTIPIDLVLLSGEGSQTLNCLNAAINDLKENDIICTLPSSKDQFEGLRGHTEYFRHKFNSKNIPMSFISPNLNVSLLTDHIPVKDISENIKTEDIFEKVSLTLNQLSNFKEVENVYFSGVNPHAGEKGLMGKEEQKIQEAINLLTKSYPQTCFHGPYPGDTLLFKDITDKDLVIFSSHDQGLAPFKLQSGVIGINITFGLPFLRVSPDHGTAFDLYGKNEANYQGCLYIFQKFA